MSGAVYASRFVVDSSSTGADILDRLMVPAAKRGCPSRKGMGADTSGRFWRLVKARPSEDDTAADILPVYQTGSRSIRR